MNDIRTGVWGGELNVTDVSFKPKHKNLGFASVSIQQMRVNRVKIHVPWSSAASSIVNSVTPHIVLDGLNAIVTLSSKNETTVPSGRGWLEEILHGIKMEFVTKEEHAILEGKSVGDSYISQAVRSIIDSLTEKFSCDVNAEANDLKISFVIPLPRPDNKSEKALHFRVSVKSVQCNSNKYSKKSLWASLRDSDSHSSSIELKGLRIAVEDIHLGEVNESNFFAEERIIRNILNPTYFTLSLHLSSSHAKKNSQEIEFTTNNIDFSPSAAQMTMILQAISMFLVRVRKLSVDSTVVTAKLGCALTAIMNRIPAQPKTPKDRWKWAISTVYDQIVRNRKRKLKGNGIVSYRALYSLFLEDIYWKAVFVPNEKKFTSEHARKMGLLHSSLSWYEILNLRMKIHISVHSKLSKLASLGISKYRTVVAKVIGGSLVEDFIGHGELKVELQIRRLALSISQENTSGKMPMNFNIIDLRNSLTVADSGVTYSALIKSILGYDTDGSEILRCSSCNSEVALNSPTGQQESSGFFSQNSDGLILTCSWAPIVANSPKFDDFRGVVPLVYYASTSNGRIALSIDLGMVRIHVLPIFNAMKEVFISPSFSVETGLGMLLLYLGIRTLSGSTQLAMLRRTCAAISMNQNLYLLQRNELKIKFKVRSIELCVATKIHSPHDANSPAKTELLKLEFKDFRLERGGVRLPPSHDSNRIRYCSHKIENLIASALDDEHSFLREGVFILSLAKGRVILDNTNENSHPCHLLSRPFAVKALLLKVNRQTPWHLDWNIDFFCSPFLLELNIDIIKRLVNMYEEMTGVDGSGQDGSISAGRIYGVKESIPAPCIAIEDREAKFHGRLNRLASSSILRLRMYFDTFSVSVLDTEGQKREKLLTTALSDFAHAANYLPDDKSNIYRVYYRFATQRLLALGIESATSVLNHLYAELSQYNVDNAVNRVVEDIIMLSEKNSRHICCLRLSGMNLKYNRLVYDSRFTFTVEKEVVLNDPTGQPLLHLEPKNGWNGNVQPVQVIGQYYNSTSVGSDEMLSNGDMSHSALSISCVLQDDVCAWAQGDCNAGSLYTFDRQLPRKIETTINVFSGSASSILSVDGLSSATDYIMKMKAEIWRDSSRGYAKTTPHLFGRRDRAGLSFHCNLGKGDVYFLERTLIATSHFDKVDMLLAYNSNSVETCWLSCESIEVLDTDDPVETHVLVIWNSSIMTVPVISVNIMFDSCLRISKVSARICGIRLCALNLTSHTFLAYFDDCRANLAPLFADSAKYSENRDSDHLAVSWDIQVQDLGILFPRNSSSNDLFSVSVEKAALAMHGVSKSWDFPEESSSLHGDAPIYFHSQSNSWLNCGEISDSLRKKGSVVLEDNGEEILSSASVGFESGDEDLYHDTFQRSINRLAVEFESVNLFVSLSGGTGTNQKFMNQYQSKIQNLGPVYTITDGRDNRHNDNSLVQRWKCILGEAVNKVLVVDFIGDTKRVLITDLESSPDCCIKLERDELYCILSVVYDNFSEVTLKEEDNFRFKVPERVSSAEYCSSDYINFIETNPMSLYMSIFISKIEMECKSTGDNEFDVPTAFKAQISGATFMVERSEELTKLAASFQALEFLPVQEENARAFCKVGCPNAINFCKYAFFDFDLDSNHFQNRRQDGQKIPVNIALFKSKLHQWATTNVIMSEPNFFLSEIDTIMEVVDFFSLYYRDKRYGNCNLNVGTDGTDTDSRPFQGSDYRILLRSPHLSLSSNPKERLSETVIFETEDGIFMRMISDSLNSRHIFVNIHDLALVILKNFVTVAARGLRAIAGSNRGVRTVVEYMSCACTYNAHDAGRSDFMLHLGPSTNKVSSISDVHFVEDVMNFSFDKRGDKNSSTSTFAVPECKILNPLRCPSIERFYRRCDIVISFEDILVISNTLRSFFSSTFTSNQATSPSAILVTNENRIHNCFFSLKIRHLKMIVVDDVLGLHLPLVQYHLSHFKFSASLVSSIDRSIGEDEVDVLKVIRECLNFISQEEQDPDAFSRPSPVAMQYIMMYGECVSWIDSFNTYLKCWEPLTEPAGATLIYEKNKDTGRIISFETQGPLHFNISSSFILNLSEHLMYLEKMFSHGGQPHIKRTSETKDSSTSSSSNVVTNYDVRSDSIRNSSMAIRHDDDIVSKISKRRSSVINRRPSYDRGSHGATINMLNSVNDELVMNEHKPCFLLKSNERAGFSIHNSTGLPARYLQIWEGSRTSLNYLEQGETGVLNFAASEKVMRNNEIIEEPFILQKKLDESHIKRNPHSLSHIVVLQICGFEWLVEVQSVSFGRKYYGLISLNDQTCDRVNQFGETVAQSFNLVADVLPHYGGRLLRLTSQFCIANRTNHPLAILATLEAKKPGDLRGQKSFMKLMPGAQYHVPLPLLYASLLNSSRDAPSFGYLWIRPYNLLPIQDEFDNATHISADHVSFSQQCINLSDIVKRILSQLDTEKVRKESSGSTKNRPDGDMNGGKTLECDDMVCMIQANENDDSKELLAVTSGRVPPFNYFASCHVTQDISSSELPSSNFSIETSNKSARDHRRSYEISIYSPIVLENLLPMEGIFQLVHATQNRVLYSSRIGPGRIKAIHTVNLAAPLLLLIKLSFCQSIQGTSLAVPIAHDGVEKEYDLVSVLTDTCEQEITINVHMKKGAANQRYLTVFCPYWIQNDSQFSLLVRDSVHREFVAGSVLNKEHDGSKLINKDWFQASVDRIFPGTPGTFARNVDSQETSLVMDTIKNQKKLRSTVFLFNFSSNDRSRMKIDVLLKGGDSDWISSYDVSLESQGVNQVLRSFTEKNGVMEVGLAIFAAPGRFARYTKIARFTPRFIIVNQMPCSIRFRQTMPFGEPTDGCELNPDQAAPFHLPERFGDRRFVITMGDGGWDEWKDSCPIDIDRTGSQIFEISNKIHLSRIRHLETRSSKEYTERLPCQTEIGLWFETSWSHNEILVKDIKPGLWAALKSHIEKGDQLIAVDEEIVEHMSFDQAMSVLKRALNRNKPYFFVTFRTAEEILRQIRAFAKEGTDGSDKGVRNKLWTVPSILNEELPADHVQKMLVSVELKHLDASVAICVSQVDTTARPEFRIANNIPTHSIFFKQKGVTGIRWNVVGPGQSIPYYWDQVGMFKVLKMYVGPNVFIPETEATFEENEKVDVLTSEIGFCIHLPFKDQSGNTKKFQVLVDSDGPSRVIKIELDPSRESQLPLITEYAYCKQMIANRIANIHTLLDIVSVSSSFSEVQGKVKLIQKQLYDEVIVLPEILGIGLNHFQTVSQKCHSYSPSSLLFWPCLTNLNQIYLDISEARDLRRIVPGRCEDVYVYAALRKTGEGILKTYLSQFWQKSSTHEKSQAPKFHDAKFIMDIPAEADSNPGLYTIVIKVKSATTNRGSVLLEPTLGKLEIPLSRLKYDEVTSDARGEEEPELEGWFYLKRRTTYNNHQANNAGSVKLKVHWVRSADGYATFLRRRLHERLNEFKALESDFQENKLIKEVGNSEKVEFKSYLTEVLRKRSRMTMVLSQDSTLPCDELNMDHISSTGGVLIRKKWRSTYSHLKSRSIAKSFKSNSTVRSEGTLFNALSPWLLNASNTFSKTFNTRAAQLYAASRVRSGTLEVKAIEVVNLPLNMATSCWVRIVHGEFMERLPTSSISNGRSTFGGGSDSSQTISFVVDANEKNGFFRLSLMSFDRFGKHEQVALVDIPILTCLDCVAALPSGSKYEAWFPLLSPTKHCALPGDLNTYTGNTILSENYSSENFDSICIKLAIRLINVAKVTEQDDHSRFHIPNLSISLIDSDKMEELIDVGINDIDFAISGTKKKTLEKSVTIGWIQIDNQMPISDHPVVLAPRKKTLYAPTFKYLSILNREFSQKNLASFDCIFVLVQELDLEIEKSLTHALLSFATGLVKGRTAEFNQQMSTYSMGSAASSPIAITDAFPALRLFQYFASAGAVELGGSDVVKYVKILKVGPIKINLSLFRGRATERGTTKSSDEEMDFSLENLVYNRDFPQLTQIGLFFARFGEIIVKMNNDFMGQAIKIGELADRHIFLSEEMTQILVAEHYIDAMLGQIYKVTGLADLFTNSKWISVGLVSSIGIGVRDFFYEPSRALLNDPRSLGKGLYKGALSFLYNTTDGIVGTATKMSRTSGRVMESLVTNDKKYLVARESNAQQPNSALATVMRPAKDIGTGIFHGITGLVREPYQNIREKPTMLNTMVGLSKGVIGVAAKPMIGVLDGITHIGDSITTSVQRITMNTTVKARRRLRTPKGIDGRVLPYDYHVAFGSMVIEILYAKDALKLGKKDKLRKFNAKIKKLESEHTTPQSLNTDFSYDSGSQGKMLTSTDQSIPKPIDLKSYIGNGEMKIGSYDTADVPGAQALEKVIFTAFLGNQQDNDSIDIFIISSERVIFLKYTRRLGNMAFALYWEHEVATVCNFDFYDNRGNGTVRLEVNNLDGPDEVVTVSGSTEEEGWKLREGYLAVCVLKQVLDVKHLDKLKTRSYNEVTETYHLGPWQYSIHRSNAENLKSKSLSTDSDYESKTKNGLAKELENSEWMVQNGALLAPSSRNRANGTSSARGGSRKKQTNTASSAAPKPSWHRSLEKKALDTHASKARQNRLSESIESIRRLSDPSQLVVNALLDRSDDRTQLRDSVLDTSGALSEFSSGIASTKTAELSGTTHSPNFTNNSFLTGTCASQSQDFRQLMDPEAAPEGKEAVQSSLSDIFHTLSRRDKS
jgi:hypothetical protein